jgi:hypothetical protein
MGSVLDSESGSASQRYGSGSFYHQAKIVRKTLNSSFVTFVIRIRTKMSRIYNTGHRRY